MNKYDCEVLHAKKRYRERFGKELTDKKMQEYITLINSDGVQPIERQSNRVSVYLIDGMRVVYDRKRRAVVTVMFAEDSPMQKLLEGGLVCVEA